MEEGGHFKFCSLGKYSWGYADCDLDNHLNYQGTWLGLSTYF